MNPPIDNLVSTLRVPNSGERRQWFLCWCEDASIAILSAVQQRSVGWNSARVAASAVPHLDVATVVANTFQNQTIRTKLLCFLSRIPRDPPGTIYYTTSAALHFWSFGHLLQVLPGSLPGFQSLELLAWQPRPEPCWLGGGRIGLGNVPFVIWSHSALSEKMDTPEIPWLIIFAINWPSNECRSLISGPTATTNNCQWGSISVCPCKSRFYRQFNHVKSKFGIDWK